MAYNPRAQLSVSRIDESRERKASFYTLAATYTPAQEQALRLAENALTDMTVFSYTIGWLTLNPAGTPAGHREERILVRAHDPSSGDKFTISIPGFNSASVTLLPDSDMLDLTDTEAAAYVTAFNAVVASPFSGQLLILDSMERTRGSK